MKSIAVIMTVFNRKDMTKKCIDSIISEINHQSFHIEFYITNDGSTDETDNLLTDYRDKVTIHCLNGDGNLFWNKGMHLAYRFALEKKYDFYLWVNNDVQFKEQFLNKLLTDYEILKNNHDLFLICGSVSYKGTYNLSYGGSINLSKHNPYKREFVIPNNKFPQECDCVNGNCLLIPYKTAIEIGNLDERFEHGFGDFDYGYRVKSKGGKCFIASTFVGECDRNKIEGTWNDASLSILERIYLKNKPNGQPFYSHKLFLKKWFPSFWIYYLIRPYFRIIVSTFFYKIKSLYSDLERI